MRTSFGSLPTSCGLAQLGSALVAASLAINCTSDDQIPQPDTGTGLAADSGVRWQTRGQGLSDGSGSQEVYYCDPAGTNARFHWQLEGSGAQPEPDCDGSGANCPTVTNHDADYESTGRLGGCRTFDGAAWIDLGDAANAHGTPGTISLWFKRGDMVAEQFIAGRIEAVEPYRGWMLAFDADNRLSFTLQHDNDTGSGADALIIRTPAAFTDTSAWHHVMVSWSWGPGGALLASDTVFSIDGTPVAAEVVSDTLAGSVDTTAAFTLGARQFDSSGSLVSGSPADFEPDYFTGEIDDVRYFDHALNVAEAASLQGVRLIADPRQCGGCDNACVNGFACVDGACEVPACPGGLQLWMDFEESAGRQVHGRQADTIDAPTRVIYAAIDERHWPDFDPLDSPFVTGPRSGESAFRFNGTVGLTLNNASGDTYALQDHDFAQGLTLSMWVYPESGAAETLLASSIEPTGDEIGWSFGLNATRQLVFLSRDSSTTSVEVHAADSLPLNTWTHVVFTFGYGGPASGRFYVDGAESTLSVDTNTAMSAPSVYVPVVLGGRVGGAETFVGALDRVLVMSAEATAVQVAELADAAQDIDACMPSHQLSCAAGTGSCDGWAITGCETDLMGEGFGVTGWFECNRCGVFASSCDEGRVVEQLLTENCDTPTDDDGDGQINCADSDCVGFPFCPGSFEHCYDAVDNESDGSADCADDDCVADYYCGSREIQCGDGVDNDTDGSADLGIDTNDDGIYETPPDTDCYDRFATGIPWEICDDGVDNNGDSLADCNDPECEYAFRCFTGERDCFDGQDDDDDGQVDCADTDCQTLDWRCSESDVRCSDGVDNDGDGLIDGLDSDCGLTTEWQCDDGLDNDFDLLLDCADPNCFGVGACPWPDPESDCSNGIDDDGINGTDCEDPNCAWVLPCYTPPEDCETPEDEDGDGSGACDDTDCVDEWEVCPTADEQDCFNFWDEDQDGLTDCADTDCASEPGCSVGSGMVGDPCDGPNDCASTGDGPVCLGEGLSGVPGGYCTGWCDPSDPLACGANGSCVQGLFFADRTSQGFCLPVCVSSATCSSGESCRLLRPGGNDIYWIGPPVCAEPCVVHADCVGTGYCDPLSGRCADPVEICDDIAGEDEDEDGLSNAEDEDCQGTFYPYEIEVSCADGFDNDDDELIDCDDIDDCNWYWACQASPEFPGYVYSETECESGDCCTNGIDDDGDGLADCADRDCADYSVACVWSEAECGDFEDNDEDGLADCFDPDCACSPGVTPFGGACASSSECAVSWPATGATGVPICIPGGVIGGLDGICTTGCDLAANDCPAGFSCLDVLMTADAGICLRPCINSSWCGAGYSCEVGDGANIFSSVLGVAVGTCSRQCTTTGDCAAGSVCDGGTSLCTVMDEVCDNAVDDNNDGVVDCYQPTCFGDAACEALVEDCDDTVDNNANYLVDCADPGCALDPACAGGTVGPGGPCTTGADCAQFGAGATCLPVEHSSGASGTCYVNCRPGENSCGVEAACRAIAGPSASNSGICMTGCQTADDCANGQRCAEVATLLSGNSFGVCTDGCSLNAECGTDEVCNPYSRACEAHGLDCTLSCAEPACWRHASCIASTETDCDDGMDRDLDGYTDCDDTDCSLASECQVTINGVDEPLALPLDQVVPPAPTSLGLYDRFGAAMVGADIQRSFGTSPPVLDGRRVVLVRGRVEDSAGLGLAGVMVRTSGSADEGYTVTTQAGDYAYLTHAVGGRVSLTATSPDYLPVSRTIDAAAGIAAVDVDFVLTPQPTAADEEVVPAGSGWVAAELDEISGSDARGARRSVAFVPPATVATLPDASVLSRPWTIRTREYTVGGNGEALMPGPVAEGTSYNYAVEYQMMDDGDVVHPTFNQAIYIWVTNFTDWFTGSSMPQGYFDHEQGRWIGERDGLVIGITGYTSTGELIYDQATSDYLESIAALDLGVARLDSLGVVIESGTPDRANLTAGEQELVVTELLGGTVGVAASGLSASYWRMPVTHFSAHDYNPYALAPRTVPAPPSDDPMPPEDPDDCPSVAPGSIVECEAQTVRQYLPVNRTPYRLEYNSRWTNGYVPARQFQWGDELGPQSYVTIGGYRANLTVLRTTTNGVDVYGWDGTVDGGSTEIDGNFSTRITVARSLDTCYRFAQTCPVTNQWGTFSVGCGAFQRLEASCSVAIGSQPTRFGLVNARLQPFGGWALNVMHRWSPRSHSVIRGDGSIFSIADDNGEPELELVGEVSMSSPENEFVSIPAIYTQPTRYSQIHAVSETTRLVVGNTDMHSGEFYRLVGYEMGETPSFATRTIVPPLATQTTSFQQSWDLSWAATPLPPNLQYPGRIVTAQRPGSRMPDLYMAMHWNDGSLHPSSVIHWRWTNSYSGGSGAWVLKWIYEWDGLPGRLDEQPGLLQGSSTAMDTIELHSLTADDQTGALYVAVANAGTSNDSIYKRQPDGSIGLVAGMTTYPDCPSPFELDGSPLMCAQLGAVQDMARWGAFTYALIERTIDAYTVQQIVRVPDAGLMEIVVGIDDDPTSSSFVEAYLADAIDGRVAAVDNASLIRLDDAGNLYWRETGAGHDRIRRLGLDGMVTTIAGCVGAVDGGDLCPARFGANVDAPPDNHVPWADTLSPTLQLGDFDVTNTELLFIDRNNAVARIPLPGRSPLDSVDINGTPTLVATISDPDSSLDYQFTAAGWHVRTLDRDTGVVVRTFDYDSNGRLTEIEEHVSDSQSLTTTVTWDSANVAVFEAPDGTLTRVRIDANGWLSRVDDPDGHYDDWQIMTARDGLIQTMTSFSRRIIKSYVYDPDSGRLVDAIQRVLDDGGTALPERGTHLARTEAYALPDEWSYFDYRVDHSVSDGNPASASLIRQIGVRDRAWLRAKRIVDVLGFETQIEQYRREGRSVVTRSDGTVVTTQQQRAPDARNLRVSRTIEIEAEGSAEGSGETPRFATTSQSNETCMAYRYDEEGSTAPTTWSGCGESFSDLTIDRVSTFTNAFGTWVITLDLDTEDTSAPLGTYAIVVTESPAGRRATRYLDERYNLISSVGLDGTTATVSRDVFNRMESLLLEGSGEMDRAIELEWDAPADGGTLDSMIGVDGRQIAFDYDDRNRVVEITEREGSGAGADERPFNLTYDERGRVDSVTPMNRNAYTWDYNDSHHTTEWTLPESLPCAVDADCPGSFTCSSGQCNYVVPPRSVVTTTDAHGRITRQVHPMGQQVDYVWDACRCQSGGEDMIANTFTMGDCSSACTPVPTEYLQTMNVNQGTSPVVEPGEGRRDFYYDAATGALTRVTNGTSNELQVRSVSGFLLDAVWDTSSLSASLKYFYDARWQLDSLQVMGDGDTAPRVVNFDFGDADGYLTSAGGVTVSRDVDTARVTTTVHGTGSNAVYTANWYNGFGELAGTIAQVGSAPTAGDCPTPSTDVIYCAEYTYEDGEIVGMVEQTGLDRQAWTYDFHPTHRALINATLAGDRSTHYEWDAQRNRIGIEQYEHDGSGEGALEFGYDGDLALIDSTERLLAYRDRDFEYDLNGRLRAESYITPGSDDRIRCYTYDVLGALHRWEDRAGPAASGVTLTSVCASPFSTITDHAWVEYDLDATGRRIGRRAWTDTGGLDEERYWVYGDELNPIAQLDAEGRVTELYVYGTHEHSPDAMITWDYGTCTGPSCTPTEAHHRILHDIRGSVRMVYNTTTGAITQQLDYDEFGVVTTNTAPFAQPFGYAGGEYDHLTGLTRFGARDYDPTLGRWTAPDPIGFAGGDSNLYSYVGGRVVGFADVTGLQEVTIDEATYNGPTRPTLLCTIDVVVCVDPGSADEVEVRTISGERDRDVEHDCAPDYGLPAATLPPEPTPWTFDPDTGDPCFTYTITHGGTLNSITAVVAVLHQRNGGGVSYACAPVLPPTPDPPSQPEWPWPFR